LTEGETRYSQIEKEALVLPWACERLDLYLIGREFTIFTDNRAVALIYDNPLSNPPAVIRRWRLRMDSFQFKVKHRAGLGNIADFLSRHPLKERLEPKRVDDSIDYVNMVASYSLPSCITKDKLISEVKADKKLDSLKKMILANNFNRSKCLNEYAQVFKELSISPDGLIMRGDKLIIPEALQEQVVNLAHAGHQGLVKTKQLIRSKVWFPRIDTLVEEKVKRCLACQACERTSLGMTPISVSDMPSAPWEELSIDFFGPIAPTKEYLIVVIDDYSRFPIVMPTFSLKSNVIEPKLDGIFSTFGIPKILRSDNGPPFNSDSFRNFCRNLGIRHRLITPLWPRANGIAEALMKPLGKVLRTAKVDGLPWKQVLLEFLRNYRSTPHSSTGVAPSALIFRNAKISKLPAINDEFVRSKLDEIARKVDSRQKSVMKNNADKNLHTKERRLEIGDRVLVKQDRSNKSMSYFDPKYFRVVSIKGNMVSAAREDKEITRNISFFKRWEGAARPEIKIQPAKSLRTLEPVRIQEVLFVPGKLKDSNSSPEIVPENTTPAAPENTSPADELSLEEEMPGAEESPTTVGDVLPTTVEGVSPVTLSDETSTFETNELDGVSNLYILPNDLDTSIGNASGLIRQYEEAHLSGESFNDAFEETSDSVARSEESPARNKRSTAKTVNYKETRSYVKRT